VSTPAVSAAAGSLTAEQFFWLPTDARRHRELIRGEVTLMAPAGFDHGLVAAALVRHLHAFAAEAGLGVVLSSETGFTISRDPDTVRAPDAAFVRADRVPPPGARSRFVELAPDLVVEVVSPSDRASDVLAKALAWVDAGVRLVWVADPAVRSVTVHGPDGLARIVRGDAELDGGDVLPGLLLALSDVFG
jgi:Uma2 family endonuclease